MIGFLAFWITVVVCLATANYPGVNPMVRNNVHDDPKMNVSDMAVNKVFKSNTTYTLVEYIDADWLRYMWWFYLVGLIWTSEFILGCLNMTIAGAVAHWFFRESKPNAAHSPVMYSISKLVKYHLGSVALGSLLITIFKIPRLIMTYMKAKLERQTSECARCCLNACICCFWALEKFICFLNHNAYTVISIESVNFCPAAVIAWNALIQNGLQVAVINGVGDFVLFLGKVVVSALCGLTGLLLLRDHEDIHFFAIPVFMICVFAFLVAHCVLSLYEMIVDTLFLCVCEDYKINGDQWKKYKISSLHDEKADAQELKPIQN